MSNCLPEPGDRIRFAGHDIARERSDDVARLIELVAAARRDGLYEDDPAWGEIDSLLAKLRPADAEAAR